MNLDARGFLAPLTGRTCTILVDGRGANLALGRALLQASSSEKVPCRVLDLDAFYASNADALLRGVPAEGQESVLFDVPKPGAEVADHVSRAFDGRSGLLVVDSLNTLHHLMSLSGRSLSFVVGALSMYAKANGVAAVLSMYRREGPGGPGKKGSIAELSDAQAEARVEGGSLVVTRKRGELWGGEPLRLGPT